MKTRFYKILFNDSVIYVGITTRTIQRRFQEHIKTKKLNSKFCSIIQIDELEHDNITSLDEYYSEYNKVKTLERKYIQEEKDKGSKLLNISCGGEWGTHILHNILKEQFFETYGSYNGFKQWLNKKKKTKYWLNSWVCTRTRNRISHWFSHWIEVKTRNKTKKWIHNWIVHRK